MSDNKLHLEKSLYLKQHAENPMHWWPYGQQALDIARKQNKLIFLSIGYSSCHWCHVMAHESFEDAEVAKFINEHFISIKVDREEYPDLDHYFQTACNHMTGRGGWPLNVFLTPEALPFFAGTYLPKVGREGMPSFLEVAKHVDTVFKGNPQSVLDSAKKLAEEISRPRTVEKQIEFKGHFPAPSAIMNALKNFSDAKNGGYGAAPKFPHFSFYEWAAEQIMEGMIPKEQGQHIVETIEKMMMGGVYDHAKGGIHRYSTDDKFLVPHFEKMLYDQAGLLKVLSKISQFYPSPIIFDGIIQTLDYLKTEMIADEGYFFSAQDADSEGTEGLYFTFSKEEFVASFDDAPEAQKKKIETFLKYFNITEKGNFDHGLNVLSLNYDLKTEFYNQEGWQEIREIRRRLLEQRKMRMPPVTDRKGIAAWNFMLLSSLADVVQYCPIDVMKNQALAIIEMTLDKCMSQFLTKDSQGRHVIKHANTLEKQALYLEDYVNFADAQLRLHEITGNELFKNNSLETLEFVIKNFIQHGDLYSTAITESTPGIENMLSPLFDQSYQSSATTLLYLLARTSVFKPELSPDLLFANKYKDYAQFILMNPLGHGQGLRAMVYPLGIYRKIEVPHAWIEDLEFIELRGHFFSRFIMTYHSRDKESYQICTKDSCEVEGKGLDHFRALFKGKDDAKGN